MKATFLIILSTILFSSITSGQRKLSKEEIIDYWKKHKTDKSKDKDVFQVIGSDTVLYLRTLKLIDSLHHLGIDSVVIYTVAYPGYNGLLDKCRTGSFPINSFAIWKSINQTYSQGIEGKCKSNPEKINSTSIFDYYEENFTTITSEFFMPIISGAELSDSNEVKYSMSFINHEPIYSIIYKEGKEFKEKEFSESELEDKKSLFHDHNVNLKSYTWWEIIKRDLKQ